MESSLCRLVMPGEGGSPRPGTQNRIRRARLVSVVPDISLPRNSGMTITASTSHVVLISPVAGSLLSFSAMPMAASSSRMRSASLKFFAVRAALRSAISASTLASSIWRAAGRHAFHAPASSCRRPIRRADALRHAAAARAPLAASERSACRAAIACGVLRSSSSASSTSAQTGAPSLASAVSSYQWSSVRRASAIGLSDHGSGWR